MKSTLKEAQKKLAAKDQRGIFNRFLQVQEDLLATGKSLVAASNQDAAYAQFARVVDHAEGLWDDACALFLRDRFATALALSITCLEEVGKIGVARLDLALRVASPQPHPKKPTTSRRRNPFYSHSQKLLLAAGAGALVNSRLDRVLGMSAVIAFLEDVESDKIESLRQSCLYSDADAGKLILPSERISREQAKLYVVLSGEVLAEVAGLAPSEWKRLIARVQEFEKQIGHAYK